MYPLELLSGPHAPAGRRDLREGISPRSLLLLLTFCIACGYAPPAARAQASRPGNGAGEVARNEGGAAAFAEAEGLRSRWEEAALRRAAEKYLEASVLWRDVDPCRSAQSFLSAGDVYFVLSDYRQALASYTRALELSRAARDRGGELDALNRSGYAHAYLGDNRAALRNASEVREACEQTAAAARDDAWRGRKAYALNTVGEVRYAFGDLRGALAMFSGALALWEEAGDRRGRALAHLNLGYAYTDSADMPQATDHYSRSLALWREAGDRRGEALAQTALGGIYSFSGNRQQALDSHLGALALFRQIGNRQGEAAAINGVAQVYEDLNEHPTALEHYTQALARYERIGNRDFIALNKYYIGRVYQQMGDPARARASYAEALALSRAVGDRQIEAHTLRSLAMLSSAESDYSAALGQFHLVLSLYRGIGDRRGVAYTINSIGSVHRAAGRTRAALAHFRRALPLIRATEDRRGEALILYNIARAERDEGNHDEAVARVRESIAIIEASRSKVAGRDLRTSYFAQAHKHYELYIDLLMQRHRRQPDAGHAAAAFLACEQARARSLLDTLTEEKLDALPGRRAELVKREAELSQLIAAKSEYRTRLLNSGGAPAEATAVAREIDALTRQYEQVRAQLREQHPRHATMTQPNLMRLEDVQAELPDDGTLLLEFSLGEERSYLWAVGRSSVEGYELPGRAKVEAAANRVYELLTARQLVYEGKAPRGQELVREADAGYVREAAALSRMLLGPLAARLDSQRLLVVTDGTLQYVPFEALPVPPTPADAGANPDAAQPRLLIDRHEVVALPSASILAAIRRSKPRSPPAAKTVIVVADPVFDKDDPRVPHQPGQAAPDPPPKGDDVYLNKALRDWNGEEGARAIPRLPASLKEAKAIVAAASRGRGTMVVGFGASRSLIEGEALKDYRIVHFATHGVLNSEQPELSGLILSLVNEEGRPQSGYLRLRDIYGLELPADLVVLSACRTGLGRSIHGEGLVGLTRGFMYAGSKGVVASLWKVDDDATAVLMKHFYEAMLRDGLQPGAALRAAKQAVREREQWRSPYYWAAFVLQGEYAGTFAESRQADAPLPRATLLLPVLLAAATLLLFWRGRRNSARTLASTDAPRGRTRSHIHHTDRSHK